VGEIRRIDELGRRVHFFTAQTEKEKDPVHVRSLFDSAPLIIVGPRGSQAIDQLHGR
jgi:V-type H+-transporting ATPase subunit a